MRRPRRPLPISIADLTYNPKTGKYEISEMGVTYQMDLEHTRSLKTFFRDVYFRQRGAYISDWFNKLDLATKKEINRIGNIQTDTDFYPDQEFDELDNVR